MQRLADELAASMHYRSTLFLRVTRVTCALDRYITLGFRMPQIAFVSDLAIDQPLCHCGCLGRYLGEV